jgi:aminoacylase
MSDYMVENIQLYNFYPDEEIGGKEGALLLVESQIFKKMNIGVVLDEGLACPEDAYIVMYGERSVWCKNKLIYF